MSTYSRRLDDLAGQFQVLFLDRLQHIVSSHLARIILDDEPIFEVVHLHRLDTRKPIQGIFDLVRSGVSDEIEAIAHPIEVQRDLARIGLAPSPSSRAVPG